MKRIYFIFSLVLMSLSGMAQCVPDATVTKPGLYPGKLPNAIVGNAYSQVATLMVPLDTALLYQGTLYNIRVDSATVVSMSDLPKGFAYECDKPSRTWNGGQRGCARLFGDPVATNVGSYVVYVKVRTFFKIIGLPNQFDQLDSSSIDFKVEMPNALQEVNQAVGLKAYPNPTKDELTLVLNKYNGQTQFEVYNSLGQKFELPQQNYSNTGEVKLNTQGLTPGVYFVKSSFEGTSSFVKFIKE